MFSSLWSAKLSICGNLFLTRLCDSYVSECANKCSLLLFSSCAHDARKFIINFFDFLDIPPHDNSWISFRSVVSMHQVVFIKPVVVLSGDENKFARSFVAYSVGLTLCKRT